MEKKSLEELIIIAKSFGIKTYREKSIPSISLHIWLHDEKGYSSIEIQAMKNATTDYLDAILQQAFPLGGLHTRRTKGKADQGMKRGRKLQQQLKELTAEYKGLVDSCHIPSNIKKVKLKNREQDLAWLRVRIKRHKNNS